MVFCHYPLFSLKNIVSLCANYAFENLFLNSNKNVWIRELYLSLEYEQPMTSLQVQGREGNLSPSAARCVIPAALLLGTEHFDIVRTTGRCLLTQHTPPDIFWAVEEAGRRQEL